MRHERKSERPRNRQNFRFETMTMFNLKKLLASSETKLAANRVLMYGRVRGEVSEQEVFQFLNFNFRYRSHRPNVIFNAISVKCFHGGTALCKPLVQYNRVDLYCSYQSLRCCSSDPSGHVCLYRVTRLQQRVTE